MLTELVNKLKLQLLLLRIVQQRQMTSRFRDVENNVEANISHQQRGLLSEVTSESAQALEAQRHSWFKKP